MKTFIRAIEAWTPSEDGTILEFGGALYGAESQFGATSRAMSFGRGEGLPGRAWDEGHPLLLKEFDGSYFRRTAAAQAAGWTCAIAIPVFLDDRLQSVLVLFCGDDEAHTGAIELWRNDPRVTTDMTLVDGYYGNTPGDFETLSRDTFLPRGSGLPGMAWQRGEAVFMKEVGQAKGFLRAQDATGAGIQRGLAIPCPTSTHETFVMTFLSGSATPIAQRIECWARDADTSQFKRVFGYCEQAGSLVESPVSEAGGSVARVFATGAPVLVNNTAALPIVSDGVVSEVVVLSL